MGGGSSKAMSKTKFEQNTFIASETDMTAINKNINESVTETTIESAQRCENQVDVKQTIKFRIKGVMGDVNLTGNIQEAEVEINFECVNTSDIQTKIQNNISNMMSSAFENSMDVDIFADFVRKADTSSEVGGLLNSGSSESKNEDETVINTEIYNKNKATMKNIIKNKTRETITYDMVSECVNKIRVAQEQEFVIEDVRGNVNYMDNAQKVIIDSYAECVNEMNIGTEIIKKIVNDSGLKYKQSTDFSSESKIESDLSTSSAVHGIGSKGAKGFGNKGGDKGNMLTIPFAISSCCCMLIIMFKLMPLLM